jgi:hypothetical protein
MAIINANHTYHLNENKFGGSMDANKLEVERRGESIWFQFRGGGELDKCWLDLPPSAARKLASALLCVESGYRENITESI